MADKPYSGFATFYNELWSKDFVDRQGDTIIALLNSVAPSGRLPRVLNLACGCGHLDKVLAQHGFIVQGVDASPEMLHYARTNAPEIPFACWSFGQPLDMMHEPFDIVLCLFDSLNYVESREHLHETFKAVRSVIRDHGHFIFDVNTAEGHSKRWGGTISIIRNWGVCTCRFSYDSETLTGKMNATGFLPKEDSYWIRFDEEHRQISLDEEIMAPLLTSAGFSNIQFIQSEELGIQPEVGRLWVIARP